MFCKNCFFFFTFALLFVRANTLNIKIFSNLSKSIYDIFFSWRLALESNRKQILNTITKT